MAFNNNTKAMADNSTTTVRATTTIMAAVRRPTQKHCHLRLSTAAPAATRPTSVSWPPTPSWTMSCAGPYTNGDISDSVLQEKTIFFIIQLV